MVMGVVGTLNLSPLRGSGLFGYFILSVWGIEGRCGERVRGALNSGLTGKSDRSVELMHHARQSGNER